MNCRRCRSDLTDRPHVVIRESAELVISYDAGHSRKWGPRQTHKPEAFCLAHAPDVAWEIYGKILKKDLRERLYPAKIGTSTSTEGEQDEHENS